MSEPRIATYRLRIYAGTQRTEPAYASWGTEADWDQAIRVRVPGFDGSATVNLADLWATALRERKTHLELPVVGRETIVKFGNTMQVRDEFTAILEIEYAD